MIRGKRGSAELVLFAAVAIIALGGLVLVSMNSGVTGMAPRPYVYDWENMDYGTLDDKYNGVTNEVIQTQMGDYGDCRWECMAREAKTGFNQSSHRPETISCMEQCAIKYGQPAWGYAEVYTGKRHFLD
jgi:hypothetical protein